MTKDPKKLEAKKANLQAELAAAEKKHRAGAAAFKKKRAAWVKVKNARDASARKVATLYYRLSEARWAHQRAVRQEADARKAKAEAALLAAELKKPAAAPTAGVTP